MDLSDFEGMEIKKRDEIGRLVDLFRSRLFPLQSSQPLLGILNFREAGIGGLPTSGLKIPSLRKYHDWSKFS